VNALIRTIEVMGIIAFALTGIYEARKKGMDIIGGVMRDIICNEIPHVFTRTELYATCAFAGSCSYLLVLRAAGSEIAAVLACIVVTFALRLLAVRYDIRLPL
jgi:uncharacterized membrane protein YeiH